MLYVVGALTFFIILLIIGVSFSQMQAAKKEQEKQLSLGEQARKIQTFFREQSAKLSNEGLVSPQIRHKYSSLASNFFVFQSINESNLTYLQSLTDLFVGLIELIDNTPDSEQLVEHIEATAHKIPAQARDFSAHFYANVAPKLISELIHNIKSLEQLEDTEEEDDETIEVDDPSQASDVNSGSDAAFDTAAANDSLNQAASAQQKAQ